MKIFTCGSQASMTKHEPYLFDISPASNIWVAKVCLLCRIRHKRHTFATRSIEKGADIKAISILLGHADPSTTRKLYFHISMKYLREVFETTNPFSNITLPAREMIKRRYESLVNL